MRLEWIAALLSPQDVAPHPNFMSEERITSSGRLAMLLQMRIAEFDRLAEAGPTELHAAGQIDEDGGDRISESLVVEAARESLDSTRSKSGASD
nr:hypothetical protein [Actinomycetota bacterium]